MSPGQQGRFITVCYYYYYYYNSLQLPHGNGNSHRLPHENSHHLPHGILPHGIHRDSFGHTPCTNNHPDGFSPLSTISKWINSRSSLPYVPLRDCTGKKKRPCPPKKNNNNNNKNNSNNKQQQQQKTKTKK